MVHADKDALVEVLVESVGPTPHGRKGLGLALASAVCVENGLEFGVREGASGEWNGVWRGEHLHAIDMVRDDSVSIRRRNMMPGIVEQARALVRREPVHSVAINKTDTPLGVNQQTVAEVARLSVGRLSNDAAPTIVVRASAGLDPGLKGNCRRRIEGRRIRNPRMVVHTIKAERLPDLAGPIRCAVLQRAMIGTHGILRAPVCGPPAHQTRDRKSTRL